MSVSFVINQAEISRLKGILSPSQLRSATYNAVLRTTKAGARIAGDAVMAASNIGAKWVRPERKKGGNRNRAIYWEMRRGESAPFGTITINGKPMPLIAYKPTVSKKSGVTVQFSKGRGNLHLPNAFKAKVSSEAQALQGVSHTGIFYRARADAANARPSRKGKSPIKATKSGRVPRGPIDQAYGPTVLSFIKIPAIEREVLGQIGNRLQKELDGQVSRFVKGQKVVKDFGLEEYLQGIGK